MKDLIEALNIFIKYGNPTYPFHCEHDTLYVCGIESGDISPEDLARLNELGFFVSKQASEGIMSYKYGSA